MRVVTGVSLSGLCVGTPIEMGWTASLLSEVFDCAIGPWVLYCSVVTHRIMLIVLASLCYIANAMLTQTSLPAITYLDLILTISQS